MVDSQPSADYNRARADTPGLVGIGGFATAILVAENMVRFISDSYVHTLHFLGRDAIFYWVLTEKESNSSLNVLCYWHTLCRILPCIPITLTLVLMEALDPIAV